MIALCISLLTICSGAAIATLARPAPVAPVANPPRTLAALNRCGLVRNVVWQARGRVVVGSRVEEVK